MLKKLFIFSLFFTSVIFISSCIPNNNENNGNRQSGNSNAQTSSYGLPPDNYGLTPSIRKKATLTQPGPSKIILPYASPLHPLPARFDLREHGWVTPSKDQGACGACVSFATIGAIESSLLMKYGVTMNLSENNLKNAIGGGSAHCSGAPLDGPFHYLTSWEGPVSEASDPFNKDNPSPTSPTGLKPMVHIQNIYEVAPREIINDNSLNSLNSLKSAIMKYGGGVVTMDANATCYNKGKTAPSSPSCNSPTCYLYCDFHRKPGHAVVVIGWDDTIPASLFQDNASHTTPVIPPGDGGFIVKNSCGPTQLENGFFYESYYDPNFATWDPIYFYDPDYVKQTDFLGQPSGNFTYNNAYGEALASDVPGAAYLWGAKPFTAINDERLEAIGTSNSETVSFNCGYDGLNVDNHYEISIYNSDDKTPNRIYTNSDDMTPLSGTLVETSSGVILNNYACSDYNTIRLQNPVQLKKGEHFFVVLKQWLPPDSSPTGSNFGTLDLEEEEGSAPSSSYFSEDGVTWISGTNLLQAGFHAELGIRVYTSVNPIQPLPNK